ncbi:MAG: thiamine pyrophosphate-dependent dehydrogenase E1 component subunit alpha [candidate division NC10 bacterium]|nr:thiamine pyrophosphate-dependent dehydrogenase E1 component subunit alpha [candidate division NC10 bacterium]
MMTPEIHRELYRLMVLSRLVDRACCELSVHWFPSEGEEAVLVGSFYGLRPDDVIAPHYRGPFIAFYMRGAALDRLLASPLGKATSYTRGRAPAHCGPPHFNIIPWVSGDLGPIISIAAGTALACRYKQSDRVTVHTIGEGTTNRGDFHEALTLAGLWKLPVVYVVQNNQYAISLHISEFMPCKEITDRAAGYGMPGVAVDGNDVAAVFETVQEAVARARQGLGPTLIEARTYRLRGHWAGDPAAYRPPEEVEAWRAQDPVVRCQQALLASGALTPEDDKALWAAAEEEVAEALAKAKAAPDLGTPDAGLNEVYA